MPMGWVKGIMSLLSASEFFVLQFSNERSQKDYVL